MSKFYNIYQGDQGLRTKTSRAAAVMFALAFQAAQGFAASWATPAPDPAGEAAFRSRMLAGMLPLAILVGAVFVALLVGRAHRKSEKLRQQEHHG
jgi:hypothetical protein